MCRQDGQTSVCLWLQVEGAVNAALTELETAAAIIQPEAFVGSPQACLFHRYTCHSVYPQSSLFDVSIDFETLPALAGVIAQLVTQPMPSTAAEPHLHGKRLTVQNVQLSCSKSKMHHFIKLAACMCPTMVHLKVHRHHHHQKLTAADNPATCHRCVRLGYDRAKQNGSSQ